MIAFHRIVAAGVLVLFAACGATGASTVPDAAARGRAGSSAPDATPSDAALHPAVHDAGALDAAMHAERDARTDAARADAAAPPPPVPGFEAIAVEPMSPCGTQRSGLVARSQQRVLITTGCGFYSVDVAQKRVVRLDTGGDTIADDGETVAVIASKLGLSRDGGATFAWTDWQLGRCQGVPHIAAGDGFALVTCVAGIGRWLGPGTEFEMLQPGTNGPVVPVAAAHGANLVINESDGWYASTDRGGSFARFRIDGLPDQPRVFEMRIAGSKLFMPLAEARGGSVLLAAPLPEGGFTPVMSLPPVPGLSTLSTSGGNLLVRAGSEFYLSRDGGESFSKLAIEGSFGTNVAAAYRDGTLYVLNDGTLYVAAAP